MMNEWGALILRGIIAFVAIFMTFAWLKYKSALQGISERFSQHGIDRGLLWAHVSSLAVFGLLSSRLYRGSEGGIHSSQLAASWSIVGIGAIIFGALAFFPLAVWLQLIRNTGLLSAYALVAAIVVCIVGNTGRWVWQPSEYIISLTFTLSKTFLGPFVSGIVENPQTMVLGTQHFRVQIAPSCSGLEGIALILAFEILWFLLFSEECRFPQSLVLIPMGIALVFVLNAIRIAALILIGNAGAPRIASQGFHSQAGWIAFSVVAMGFCLAIQNVPWFTSRERKQQPVIGAPKSPTTAFLLPFLMILAAGMIAGASSSGFEWLYPMRFVAAAATLWILHQHNKAKDKRGNYYQYHK